MDNKTSSRFSKGSELTIHRLKIFTKLTELQKRLVDTCIGNALNFIQDSTNFQPDLTPRNYIRHVLEMDDDNKNAPVSPVGAYRLNWIHLLTPVKCRL